MIESDRRVRIVRVITRLNTGGPAIHTILLTSGLNGGRFSSRLVTGVVDSGEGDMTYYARQMNVVPFVIPELGRRIAVKNDLKVFFRLCRVLWEERPDIIHTHTAKAGGLGRLAGLVYNLVGRPRRRCRAKLVHTFHGHVFHGYFSPWRSRWLVLAEQLLARFTDRIIAVSESVKRDLVDRYRVCGEGKVSVLPLGLDFGWVGSLADRGHLREALGVSPGALVIGIVGRLTEVKNQGLLFSSLRLVGRDNMRVLVFGDGERRASLEQLVQDLGLGESVIFVGWQRDPARIYAGLDIVCLTSRNEGTPVALIEAMAAGRAVVSTRVGGVPDLMVGAGTIHEDGFEVFANGILVPADNPPALAAALRLLADRPDLRRAMGTAGQASVLDRFSKERMLEGMERVYAALVDGRNEGVACEH